MTSATREPAATGSAPTCGPVETSIPNRLDSLPWSRWHWRMIAALGTAWILDGIEVTLVGSLGPALLRPDTLAISASDVGWAGSAYVGGAVLGALVFGRASDRLGRRRLFLITLAVYLAATLLTSLSFDFWSFAFCRFLTGLGIGGEYAAINSAIDEMIPARVRGTVSLGINGSFWVGAALGSGLSLVLLDPDIVGPQLGWRLAFASGALLGIAILLVRRHVPESPRWLIMHGRHREAEAVVARIEAEVESEDRTVPPVHLLRVRLRPVPSWREILRLLLVHYRRRTVLGLALMAAQAFFYNAIFFTYALLLTRFYDVPAERVGLYLFPFAAGNFLGPLALGWMYDVVGRRVMIASSYGVSGLALLATGFAFMRGWLGIEMQSFCWSAIFFVASAAASSAYLTVSEIFPVEMRAVTISIFYAIGTGVGGILAPAFFGALIESGSRDAVFVGYACAAALMCAAAVLAVLLGVDSERKPLEEVATPLSAE